MENQHSLDTYYYKLPTTEHQRSIENQRCRDDISRAGNTIPRPSRMDQIIGAQVSCITVVRIQMF